MKHHLHDRIPVIDLFAGPGGFVSIIRRKPGKAFEAVGGKVAEQVGTRLGLSRDQVEILRNCASEKAIGELMSLIGRANRTKFRNQVLRPLLDAGLIEMTIPDKPTSSKQKYRLTETGKQILNQDK